MEQHISAADIEKFGYCPLSWWLSWKDGLTDLDNLKDGQIKHNDIAEKVIKAKKLELNAITMERIVLWFAVIATLISISGIELLPNPNKPDISAIMIAISLIWVLAAVIILRLSFLNPVKDKLVQYEKLIIVFAIVAAIMAVNAVIFLEIDERLAITLEAIALVWLIAASYSLQRSLSFSHAARKLKEELNIKGKIEYVDTDHSELLVSAKYGISGRPDYVMMAEGTIIPVEEKTGRIPRGPLFSHILQVGAYCLLLEEKSGKPVPYGILKYGTDQHIIEFDDMLRKTLLQKITEMKNIANGKQPAHRNHNRPSKCKGCSRREICPEKLE